MRPDGAKVEDAKSDNGHERVDEEHSPPQVAQNFLKNASLAFFDVIGRSFKARHSKHTTGKTIQEHLRQTAQYGLGGMRSDGDEDEDRVVGK